MHHEHQHKISYATISHNGATGTMANAPIVFTVQMDAKMSKLLWVNHSLHAVHILYRLTENDTAVLAITEHGRCALYVDQYKDEGVRERSIDIFQNWMFVPC